MYQTIKLIIADDHDLFRDGLKTLLEKNKQFEVVAEATNGRELVELCKQLKPDVVLTDIQMPLMDGTEATEIITRSDPSIKIIALSMFNQDYLIFDMLKAGASGYLIKNAARNEILEAIESVSKDIPYYCRTTSIRLAKMIGSNIAGARSPVKPTFTEKELSIISLICEGKTSREIGDEIFMSPRTVDEHRERIRAKMNVKGIAGIVIYAIRNNLVKF